MGNPRGRRPRAALLLAWLALLLAALLSRPAVAAPTYPPVAGRVTDAAGVLPADTRAALEQKLADLERTTGTELAVATVPDLQGYEVEDYANGLFRAWGIGKKASNNGALLLVAPNERKVRIEVGYGLEGVVTDALSGRIIRGDIVPRFKAGDIPGGIVAGTDALIGHLELPPDQQRAALAAADARASRGDGGGFTFGTFVWLVIILAWIFFAGRRGRRGRRRGPVVIWGPGIGGGWGGGSGGGWGGGGFGGGGGGFGGFGGGSSGGGGASGSW